MAGLYLSASSDAIDAALVTKGGALRAFLRAQSVAPRDIGVIGDSVNDLPFLTLPDVGMRAAPTNAQPEVLRRLAHLPNTVPLSAPYLEGFLRFYESATDAGLTHVFADRDGVLVWTSEREHERRALAAIFERMGRDGAPRLIVLTGSSVDQNRAFMDRHGLDAHLASNPVVAADPYVVWAENGSLKIDVIHRTARTATSTLDPDLLAFLKGPFEGEATRRLEAEVLPSFHLTWSRTTEHDSQVYLPPKATMFTVNVPRVHRGRQDYRTAHESDRFRQAVLALMTSVADRAGVRYEILGVGSRAEPVSLHGNQR